VWIHLPSTYRPSAPESGDSNSASSWRSQLLAQSASLRGKPTAAKSWLRGWKTAAWMKPLFGRICEPSTASRGVGSWIASLAATRASRSPSPESERATGTNVTCGLKSPASSEKSAPSGVSSRTSATTYVWGSSRSKTSFAKWVTSLRRACSQRRKLGPHTNGNGYSLWRTPATTDVGTPLSKLTTKDGGPPQFGRRMYRDGKDGSRINQTQSLGLQALLWHSLRIQTTEKDGQESLPSRPQLNPLFVEWLMGWPLGWTACGRAATESYRQWRHSHGGPSLAA